MMVIVPAALFTAPVLLTETAEWALSLWRKQRKPDISGKLAHFPRVSIHVPTHNEPPLMVMQTLNALARLDYPNFEVILLDNNTSDESLWRPVASHCETLGSRFRFYHFDDVKGFKAGALNKALRLTDPAAEYIAVIDSDYQVAPHWLRSVMPGFDDPKVGIVQAPQDYRDGKESLFKSILYEEYTGFFRIGMVERNEHNAIIQHGTMCVIRREAMDRDWRLGRVVHHRRHRVRLARVRGRLYRALYAGQHGPRPDARHAMPRTRSSAIAGSMAPCRS